MFQIQGFFFTLTTQMIYVGWVMPFETSFMNQLELLNISVTLFASYFLLTFTPFVYSNRVKYNISWVLISVIALAIAVNIIFFLK